MFEIKSTVYDESQKETTITLTLNQEGCKIVRTFVETDSQTTLQLTMEEGDALFTLMQLARPTHDGGLPYQG